MLKKIYIYIQIKKEKNYHTHYVEKKYFLKDIFFFNQRKIQCINFNNRKKKIVKEITIYNFFSLLFSIRNL